MQQTQILVHLIARSTGRTMRMSIHTCYRVATRQVISRMHALALLICEKLFSPELNDYCRANNNNRVLQNYDGDRRYLTKDLEPGTNYVMSFYFAANLPYDSDTCSLYVLVGTSFSYTMNLDAYTTAFQYQQATIPIVVSTESIQVVIMLQCVSFALENIDFYMLLDDFTLTDDKVPVGCVTPAD